MRTRSSGSALSADPAGVDMSTAACPVMALILSASCSDQRGSPPVLAFLLGDLTTHRNRWSARFVVDVWGLRGAVVDGVLLRPTPRPRRAGNEDDIMTKTALCCPFVALLQACACGGSQTATS
ncbi:MAG: hypothetical protein K0V04_05145 [Deltaproteobacteria bacterium]|nr:hypothetical protein [Deltaproteobacteria bacterium]